MSAEDGRKPTLEELRGMIKNPSYSNPVLKPSFEVALPKTTLEEDWDTSLAFDAGQAYLSELNQHPELTTKVSRLKYIKDTLKYDDAKIAKLMGITPDQVARKDLRGRRKLEVGRFTQRFEGLFTLASILERNFHDKIDSYVDRRAVLEAPNGKLTEMSVNMAVGKGYINLGVAIALRTIQQNQDMIGQERHIDFEA